MGSSATEVSGKTQVRAVPLSGSQRLKDGWGGLSASESWAWVKVPGTPIIPSFLAWKRIGTIS